MNDQQKQNENTQWLAWMFRRMTVFFGLGVLAAGTYVADFYSRPTNKKELNIQYPAITHTAKARSPMHASVDLDGEAPTKAGDEFTLVVNIGTDKPAEKIRTRWVLPKGIELVRGSLEYDFDKIELDEVREFSATFMQVSEVNEQIHFKASASATGMRSSLTVQYNSLDQERIDQENKNLREIASEHMKKDMAVKALEKGKSHAHSHMAQ